MTKPWRKERATIQQLLQQAGHPPTVIADALRALDEAVSYATACRNSLPPDPRPQLKAIHTAAADIERHLLALEQQDFPLDVVPLEYTGHSLTDVRAVLAALGEWSRYESEIYRKPRGQPPRPSYERHVLLGVHGVFCRVLDLQPTATQGNLFESVLGKVLAATVGERSEDHVHRLAASVIKSLKIAE